MPCEMKRFLLTALDPVHVGAGGYRLGRVDMTIVREPGTNVPKIPGTSLSGAARSYAAMQAGIPEAAGQHKKYAGQRPDCPILYTFGTASDEGQGRKNFAGTVSISDARVLFFPVYSRVGPVWVTTPQLLSEAGFSATGGTAKDDGTVATTIALAPDRINVGWLLLPVNPVKSVVTRPAELAAHGLLDDVLARLVLVSPKYFTQVVNSNLEVRTSVVIDPETGAALKGGLFTYEAIPRATILASEVVEDDYSGAFPAQSATARKLGATRPLEVVRKGFDAMELMGVGGMGTRGFGRLRLEGVWG